MLGKGNIDVPKISDLQLSWHESWNFHIRCVVICLGGISGLRIGPKTGVSCPFIHPVGNPNCQRHPKRFYEATRSDRNRRLVIPEFPGAAVAPGSAGDPDRLEMGP